MVCMLFAIFLVLLNVNLSLQALINQLEQAIKNTETCKDLQKCDVPKIESLALENFPARLKKPVEFIVKTIVVLEHQTKESDAKIGQTLTNTIVVALEACRLAQKAFTNGFNRLRNEKGNAMKMIKSVVEVTLSKDNKMSCVVMATSQKYSREQCQSCQRMIPDFLDGLTAEQFATTLVREYVKKAPPYITDYLTSIKTFAASSAEYMDKLQKCVKGGKQVSSCRDNQMESSLINRMRILLSMGKHVIGFMDSIGTSGTSEMQGLVGRVTTTHKSYKHCLLSGAATSARVVGTPVETSVIDKYEDKVKGQMRSLKDVATRALKTKLRMLRERRLQRNERNC